MVNKSEYLVQLETKQKQVGAILQAVRETVAPKFYESIKTRASVLFQKPTLAGER